jgi:NhaA family Na+:H+ antiporter
MNRRQWIQLTSASLLPYHLSAKESTGRWDDESTQEYCGLLLAWLEENFATRARYLNLQTSMNFELKYKYLAPTEDRAKQRMLEKFAKQRLSGRDFEEHASASLAEFEEGVGGAVLLGATAISLALANTASTSGAWLNFWAVPRGLKVAGHALSLRGWCNEGLMAIFFFVVGLEIKQELRQGSLKTPRTAALPCIAAVGGMVTPMAVYALINMSGRFAGGSLAALAVPMATDIAFAMAIFSLFKARMPAASSAFLLTLATVDDLGAIIVLATCYATSVATGFLGLAAIGTALLTYLGNSQASAPAKDADARVFALGGVALWWCLLRAGVSADIAGVVAGMCVSTRAMYKGEPIMERLIHRLSPLATFGIMPVFALANTAVPLGQALSGGVQAALAPALGIGLGLLIGKPLGIFGSTWLATKFGIASMPAGMTKRHLAVVSTLGAIGFTMCLLLTEVAMPPAAAALLSRLRQAWSASMRARSGEWDCSVGSSSSSCCRAASSCGGCCCSSCLSCCARCSCCAR